MERVNYDGIAAGGELIEMAEGELTREMGGRLQGWLDGSEGPGPLIGWLQGDDLPPVGYADEPHLWLLRGIEAIGPVISPTHEGQTYDHLFCKQVAGLLKSRPDRDLPGRTPERLLYNLFLLCAGLRCPSCLADGLRVIVEAKQLSGSWLGVDLRSTLRSALVENQVYEQLRDLWLNMIRSESDFLPGDEFDGMAGLLAMPESESTRGQPAVVAICIGLTALVHRLDNANDEYHRGRLVEMIDEVKRAFPNYDGWDRDFIVEGADPYQWPKWAITALAPLTSTGELEVDFYAWRVLADSVRNTQGIRPAGQREICGGNLVLLRVSEAEAMDRLIGIAHRFETILVDLKEKRFKTVRHYINEVMRDIESEDEAEDETKANDIVGARHGFLKRYGILADASC